jgi:hypothetical protein
MQEGGNPSYLLPVTLPLEKTPTIIPPIHTHIHPSKLVEKKSFELDQSTLFGGSDRYKFGHF